MTARRPCPPAPGPLEDYATQFDPLLASVAQRRGLRDYLQGLLLPRDRNKTLTALADAEPITGAQHREVQRLQWFLSESTWDHQAVNRQRIALLQADPATAPHGQGVLVIDDTGDRKDGSATAHVARQYLGSVGKTDNGIVAVTSLWADARCYWPLHAVPYTPVSRLAKGKSDPGFGPSRSWPPSWSSPPKRPRSGSGRWWPTASTATTPALWRRWVAPGWRSCWRSSPARVSGRPMMRRTRR
jgi:SRSO17 transposase